jgi:hypothetical protein
VQKPEKLAVSLKDAAYMLSISVRTLARKIEKREIAACRATRYPTIPVDELKRYLAKNTIKL